MRLTRSCLRCVLLLRNLKLACLSSSDRCTGFEANFSGRAYRSITRSLKRLPALTVHTRLLPSSKAVVKRAFILAPCILRIVGSEDIEKNNASAHQKHVPWLSYLYHKLHKLTKLFRNLTKLQLLQMTKYVDMDRAPAARIPTCSCLLRSSCAHWQRHEIASFLCNTMTAYG